jgi:hypothetical protein
MSVDAIDVTDHPPQDGPVGGSRYLIRRPKGLGLWSRDVTAPLRWLAALVDLPQDADSAMLTWMVLASSTAPAPRGTTQLHTSGHHGNAIGDRALPSHHNFAKPPAAAT